MQIEVVTPSDSLEHLKMILEQDENKKGFHAVSYTHLRAHET